VYSVGFTPLQALYPVEVLSFEMRAKGMGFSGFAVAAGKSLPIPLFKIKCLIDVCRSYVTQPIRVASCDGQDRLAHIHHILWMVWCSSDSNLLLHPRNEEQNSMPFPPLSTQNQNSNKITYSSKNSTKYSTRDTPSRHL
jgi:hypothetical protein